MLLVVLVPCHFESLAIILNTQVIVLDSATYSSTIDHGVAPSYNCPATTTLTSPLRFLSMNRISWAVPICLISDS
jgi:hypothetical protein